MYDWIDNLKFPHDVPSEVGQTVMIRDGYHKGTRVTNTGNGFLFESLDTKKTREADRCALVELAPPEYDDETGWEISSWETAMPDVPYGCDLEGKGYALIGLEKFQDLDERVGVILWDSWSGQ